VNKGQYHLRCYRLRLSRDLSYRLRF